MVKRTEGTLLYTAMLYSGGLDSFVSAALLLESGKNVRAMFFDYGQVTSNVELQAASSCIEFLKEKYGANRISLSVENLFDYKKYVDYCAIVTGVAPDSSQDGKLIFVPGRNIVFLLFASIACYKDGVREVVFSSHKSDRVAGDCRSEFISALQSAFSWGFGIKGVVEPYKIWSPLQEMTKSKVVGVGISLGLSLERSWSCYRSGDIHCGVCHNCRDRREAFEGYDDPTKYENY